MGIRRQARECALQIVFQLDTWPSPRVDDADDAVARFFENFDAPDEKARSLAAQMARGVTEKRAAFDELSRLADGNHAEAARIALQMHRYGPILYGAQFALSTAQVAHWKVVALQGNDLERTASFAMVR